MFSRRFKIIGYVAICALFIGFLADLYHDIGRIDFKHDSFTSWETIIRYILIFSFLSCGAWHFTKMMKEDEKEDSQTEGLVNSITEYMYAPYKYALKKSLIPIIIIILCSFIGVLIYNILGISKLYSALMFIPGVLMFIFVIFNHAKREYCDMEAIAHDSNGIFVFRNDSLYVVDTNIKYKDLIKATYNKSLDKIININKDKELIILKATQIIENVYGLKFR